MRVIISPYVSSHAFDGLGGSFFSFAMLYPLILQHVRFKRFSCLRVAELLQRCCSDFAAWLQGVRQMPPLPRLINIPDEI